MDTFLLPHVCLAFTWLSCISSMWEGQCWSNACQILTYCKLGWVSGKEGFILTEGSILWKNNPCPIQMLRTYNHKDHNGSGCALSTEHLLSTMSLGLDGHSQGSDTDTTLSQNLKSENFCMAVPLSLHLLPQWSSPTRHLFASLALRCCYSGSRQSN